MKKRLIIIGVSCLFAALCVAGYFIIKSHLEARPYDAKIDGIYYKLDKTNHTATVTKIFDHEKDYTSYSGDITIPSSIKRWGKTYSVTSIERFAFAWSFGLQSVFIPNSVTEIGENAFYECSSLISITIPNSVTKIGDRAFRYCTAMFSATIGYAVSNIGANAFADCSNLQYVTCEKAEQHSYNPNKVYTPEEMFSVSPSLLNYQDNYLTSIGDSAFWNCSSLISVTIPNSVSTIGKNAFSSVLNIVYSGTATGSPWGAKCVNGCVDGYLVYSDATRTTLCGCSSAATDTIIIPNSVTTIGDWAFYNCKNLTSITIPNSVTKIGEGAFWGCFGLTSVTIPGSVTSIGDFTFLGCSTVYFGNNNSKICQQKDGYLEVSDSDKK